MHAHSVNMSTQETDFSSLGFQSKVLTFLRWMAFFVMLAGPSTLLAQAATSMDMAYEVRSGNDYLYVANPDHNSVTVVDTVTGNRIREIAVGEEPVSVALDGLGYLWVTNKGSATLSIISTTTLSVVNALPGPYGSRPHGIVIDASANRAYVVLEALSTIYQLNTQSGALINQRNVGGKPRHISINENGSRLYVPKFITARVSGENTRNPANGNGELLVLATSNLNTVADVDILYNRGANGGDTRQTMRGVPNYLGGLALSPDETRAVIPGKIDNIYRGTMRSGQRRLHDRLTRGILATVNLQTMRDIYSDRVEFINNSHPTAATYSPDGLTVFAVHEGSRAFEAIDAATGSIRYETTLGYAPSGIVLSNDGRRAFVHNWLSRTVSILDTSDFAGGRRNNATVIATVNLVTNEALSPTVLLGKRLFHDSADPRMSGDRFISCSSCHNEGGEDGRIYDFSDVGEGLRNTADMRGRGDMEDGLVHWTGNFDEIQDFESAMREIFGGAGLMTDADFNATAAAIDPAAMKTGLSADLDAMVAFVDTLDDHGESPFRNANGSLTAQGLRGREVFNRASCATCHSGSNFTDSPLGGSHNVGTVDDDTGGRFGQPLVNGGLDTPTLQGLWDDAPYLHDGSALTILDAIQGHTEGMPVPLSTFTSAELQDLAAYTLQIDDNEPSPAPPTVPPSSPDTFSTFISIAIDGSLSDWSSSARLVHDPRDASSGTNNQLDYQTVWMANDVDNLYIRYRNHTPHNARLTWGYGQAIDVDGPSTGYRPAGNRLPIGTDFLIEEQSIYRYTGDGNSWSWAWVAPIEIEFRGRNAELAVPRSILGSPASFNFFMYTDNNAIGGTAIDFIPDSVTNTGASFDTRFMSYEFAGGSAPPPPAPPTNNDPFVYSNPVNSLVVDGSSSDWQQLGLEFFPPDPDDVSGTSNRIDFLQAGVAHNNNNFYFGWANDGATRITWGNAIFVDTDLNFNTGFRGFQNESPTGIDYLIEASSVYRYTGNGTSWTWEWVGSTHAVAQGNSLEIRVPVDLLNNPTTIDLFFYGDSSAIGGTGTDFYPDAATNTTAEVTSRRFRYSRNTSLADAPQPSVSND